MESQLRREMRKIKRNLDGIRKMNKLPGALIVIDVRHETTALKEARKLGIPTICLIDSDGDPGLADIAIPGNDDSMRSIDVIVRELCMSVAEGKQQRAISERGETEEDGQDRPRRSRRAQFRSDDPSPEPAPEPSASPGTPAQPVAGQAD